MLMWRQKQWDSISRDGLPVLPTGFMLLYFNSVIFLISSIYILGKTVTNHQISRLQSVAKHIKTALRRMQAISSHKQQHCAKKNSWIIAVERNILEAYSDIGRLAHKFMKAKKPIPLFGTHTFQHQGVDGDWTFGFLPTRPMLRTVKSLLMTAAVMKGVSLPEWGVNIPEYAALKNDKKINP